MTGIQYVMNDHGEKTAVLIDLKKHGDLWEDFFDCLTKVLNKQLLEIV